MLPFFWRDTRNFGDWCNNVLWPELIPDLLDPSDGIRLVGVGSLLKSTLRQLPGRKIIFGSGSGYGAVPTSHDLSTWEFRFVRGPLTAREFRLDPDFSVVDGAWLFGLLDGYAPKANRSGIAFVPHWISAKFGQWHTVSEMAGLRYVDPTSDFHEVINSIATSDLVITESLHGAIFADLFRVPWIPVAIGPDFLPFKWLDWAYSLDIRELEVVGLPYSSVGEFVRYRSLPTRSPPKLQRVVLADEDVRLSVDLAAPFSPARYSRTVKMKQTAKRMINPLAEFVSSSIVPALARTWEQDRHQRVAKLLQEVSQIHPYMSSDSVRSKRLEQLESKVRALRQDYGL